MGWHIDIGDDEEQAQLELHLAERGLSVDDIWSAASPAVGRRKGDRLLLHGRALDGTPIIVVLAPIGSAWRPRTAWPMNGRERRWWQARGGR